MKPVAYYNEIDPFAAQWLRNLIAAGHIAPGEIDERSILDVHPLDLIAYNQCHFFAGIGVWSYALRLAGWPDDRPVWTASCPCQPFSAAGKRGGVEDERHLWPEVARLVRECGPGTLFGEQVASKDGLAWLDTVHSDLEAEGYAVGALDTCAAGFGAPHIRQRLYFVGALADTEGRRNDGALRHNERQTIRETVGRSPARQLANSRCERGAGRGGIRDLGEAQAGYESTGGQRQRVRHTADDSGATSELADAAHGDGRSGERQAQAGTRQEQSSGRDEAPKGQQSWCRDARGEPASPSSTSGHWHPADWLACIDGKARPVEPGTFPLAHGIAGRVGRLRAYGNCIVAPQAEEFVKAYLACRP